MNIDKPIRRLTWNKLHDEAYEQVREQADFCIIHFVWALRTSRRETHPFNLELNDQLWEGIFNVDEH